MIKSYVFEKDKVKIKALQKSDANSKIVWTHAVNPTKEEISQITGTFGVTRGSVKYCLDPEERARVENEDSYSLIIFKVPFTRNRQVSTISLGVIISRRFILSISSAPIPSLGKIAKTFDNALVHKHRYQYIFSQILLKVTRDYFEVLDTMGERVDRLESKLLENKVAIQVKKVFASKKTLLYFRKALITNRDVLMFLEKGGSPYITKKSDIESLRMENLQLMDMEELIRGRLSETVNMYLTTVSNNLNVSMKYFAVIAALFLMPMLITGAYGMNFKVLPLATNPYGFWIMVGLMVVAMFFMFLVFKRKDWI